MAEPLTADAVRHVARLARLDLDDAEVERFRAQLATVLDHLARLEELDLDGVEPLAHPGDLTDRFEADAVRAPMPLEDLLRNAPAVRDRYFAVPKVLDDGGGA